MSRKNITPITIKVNLIIIISLVLGIGIAVYSYLQYHFSKLSTTNAAHMASEADILYNSIETMMIPGNASLALGFFEKTNLINPDYTIKLYRTNGRAAFSDNATINNVNSRIGFGKFNTDEERADDNDAPIDEYFKKVLAMNPSRLPNIFLWKDPENRVFFRMYQPLQNIPACFGCHGADHTFRGVLDIRNNITKSVNEQNLFLAISVSGVFLLITALAVILTQFLRNTIIKPVKVIGDVCANVTNGVFSSRVKIKNNDEIGVLGNTVNKMVEGLHERYELSKYVSASTIQSLRDEKKGKKVPLTILFSDIRSFTSFSEKKPPEIVVEYLNRILSFQTEIIQSNNGDVDKYVGDEIIALYAQNNPELSACKSALAIRHELETNSETRYGGLHVGIGINTGEVILGMIGSEKRADYTVIGDNVNTASRLCDVAKPDQIVLAKSVFEKVKDQVDADGPFKVRVKGKEDYVFVYLLKNLKGNAV